MYTQCCIIVLFSSRMFLLDLHIFYPKFVKKMFEGPMVASMPSKLGGNAVVFYALATHTFSAEIKCRHCTWCLPFTNSF